MGKITTIIPTYKRPYLLEKAIRSVLAQTFTDFVIYIFDNASGDETERVVHELQAEDDRIYYVCRKKNIGLIANFVHAVKCVQTPFFHFFSDDDYIFPWFYATAMEGFLKYPDIGLSHCRTLIVNESYQPIPAQFKSPFHEGYYLPPKSLLKLASMLPTWTGSLFRKEALDLIGGLQTDVGTTFDFVFHCQVASRFPVFFNRKASALFFTWEQSTTFLSSNYSLPTNYDNMKEVILSEAKYDENTHSKLSAILTTYSTTWQKTQWRRLLASGCVEKLNTCQAPSKTLGILVYMCKKIPLFSWFIRPLIVVLKKCRTIVQKYQLRAVTLSDDDVQKCLSQCPNERRSIKANTKEK